MEDVEYDKTKVVDKPNQNHQRFEKNHHFLKSTNISEEVNGSGNDKDRVEKQKTKRISGRHHKGDGYK